jgi:hypothetical protein
MSERSASPRPLLGKRASLVTICLFTQSRKTFWGTSLALELVLNFVLKGIGPLQHCNSRPVFLEFEVLNSSTYICCRLDLKGVSETGNSDRNFVRPCQPWAIKLDTHALLTPCPASSFRRGYSVLFIVASRETCLSQSYRRPFRASKLHFDNWF